MEIFLEKPNLKLIEEKIENLKFPLSNKEIKSFN